MRFPFEMAYQDIEADLDTYVTAVVSGLVSEFLVMPKGVGFVNYPAFENGYEALKQATSGFTKIEAAPILQIVQAKPITAIILRAILGFTPSEWAYVATQRTGVEVSQGFARALDRNIRIAPDRPLRSSPETLSRLDALVTVACQLIVTGAPITSDEKLHRLDKADTRAGTTGLRTLADLGVPYAMLLYERFLGRPFAGHRDSVSDLIGDVLESAIEKKLADAGISFQKTRRAERVPGFDQAPDFIVPDIYNPRVVIEAKITEDDGTARDKVTRVQHLHNLSLQGSQALIPRFEVIACIGGRGFGVRREDMKKLIIATRGKVFTSINLDRLIDCTQLQMFRTK